jgi:hypothetical protein
MNETKVEVTVHERVGANGYVVKITADTEPVRTRKLPVDDFDEAAALAESIAAYIQVGGDLDVFLPDDTQDTATNAPGAP